MTLVRQLRETYVKQRSVNVLYADFSQNHEHSKIRFWSLRRRYRMPRFLTLFDSGLLFPQSSQRSILCVTPQETCVPWSHVGQVVMVIDWVNWLVCS